MWLDTFSLSVSLMFRFRPNLQPVDLSNPCSILRFLIKLMKMNYVLLNIIIYYTRHIMCPNLQHKSCLSTLAGILSHCAYIRGEGGGGGVLILSIPPKSKYIIILLA